MTISPEQRAHITAHYEKLEAEGINIECNFNPIDDATVEVTTHIINARGKGGEAMRLIATEIQKAANDYGLTFLHRALPTNPASIALLEKTEGYTRIPTKEGDDFNNWEKSFTPNKQ